MGLAVVGLQWLACCSSSRGDDWARGVTRWPIYRLFVDDSEVIYRLFVDGLDCSIVTRWPT